MLRQGKTPAEISDYIIRKDDAFCKLEMVHARIKLRVNPIEHIKIIDVISSIITFESMKKDFDSMVADSLVDDLVKETQVILKSEWKRVKRGEPIFVATKLTSLFLFFIAIILGFVYAFGHIHI
jgi:hypothetical protein